MRGIDLDAEQHAMEVCVLSLLVQSSPSPVVMVRFLVLHKIMRRLGLKDDQHLKTITHYLSLVLS